MAFRRPELASFRNATEGVPYRQPTSRIMSSSALTPDQLRRFQDDGFFVVDSLLSHEEVELLGKIARRRHADEKQAASRRDGQGGAIRLAVHNELERRHRRGHRPLRGGSSSRWSGCSAAKSTIITTS